MERDEIVKMAREAGWPITDGSALIESLGALVDAATEKANERANASWASMCEKMVAAEREACAKVCEQQARHAGDPVTFYTAVGQCASAIRAQGNA